MRMRILLLLLAICILIEAKKGKGKGNKPEKPGKGGGKGGNGGKGGKPEKGEMDGVCISGTEMMGICTANTNFEVKMDKAMITCKKGEAPIDMMANTPRKGKGKGKGKGGNKPGKCPTAEELMEKMEGMGII